MKQITWRQGLVVASAVLYLVLACLAPLDADARPAIPASIQGGHPARYIVLEQDAAGAITPLYERNVMLADELVSKSDQEVTTLLQATSRQDDKVEIRVKDLQGRTTFADVVEVPAWIRGEFDGGGGRIEGHVLPAATRQFAVRIPVQTSGTVTLSDTTGAMTAVQLSALDAPLPLDAILPTTAAPPPPPPANRVDLLIMGDGYRSDQASLFNTHAANLLDSFFDISPYAEYRNFVNTATLFTASPQAGADHPPYVPGCEMFDASCCGDSLMQSDPLRGTFVSTAFNGAYCTLGIHRLVTVDTGLVLAAASAYPDWDSIMVVVNDQTYGGSGGPISVISTHVDSVSVAQHEHGHSFTGLADEYDTPTEGFPPCSDIAGPACEVNVTDQTVRSLIKWLPWINDDTPIPTSEDNPEFIDAVGLFEGARYQYFGMYRPSPYCLMEVLYAPFCEVASQAYVLKLYQGGWGLPANGIDLIQPGTEVPAPGPVAFGATLSFSFGVVQPVGAPPLAIQWYVNGLLQPGKTSTTFQFNPQPATNYEIRADVRDPTPLVHQSMAAGMLNSRRSWYVGTGAPASLALDIAPPSTTCDGVAPVNMSATVLKANGQPVPNNTFVSFEVAGATITSTEALTVNGVATTTLTPVATAPGTSIPVTAFTGGLGQTYYISCGFAGPPNDDFAFAQDLPMPTAFWGQSTIDATLEPDEPVPCGNIASTVWFSFIFPVTRPVEISALLSDFDTVLAVYEDSVSSPALLGSLLGCNDDAGNLQSAITISAQAGETYYVQAGGKSGQTGNLVLIAQCIFDDDCDGWTVVTDNCPTAYNPDQTNTDAMPLVGAFSTPPPAILPPNDHTRPNGDALGDACDPDDDNDGLIDDVEYQLGVPSPPGPCPQASAPTNPFEHDTDGDRVIDGAECALGSNPASATSTPPTCAAQGKLDSDGDRLCNDLETAIGSNPAAVDTDGDKIGDGVEYRGYGSSPLAIDTDLDGCSDGREIASVNTDKVVSSIDQGIVASQFGRSDRPVQDIDKNGSVTANDLLIVALNFGSSPC